MISVEREAATPDVFAALNRRRRGLTEREASIWFFAGVAPDLDPLPAKPGEAPEFEAYSHEHVKQALNRMFGGHCAYCESRYEHVSPMDVEHYRPKGAVIEVGGRRVRPGYYWLAADWDNLLPSCIGCNRAREQEQRAEDGSVAVATSGKGNQFPLSAASARAMAAGDEAHEQALLLDPCRDDPDLHLRFRADGHVEPRYGAEEAAMPRGLATIEVCGLVRNSLVGRRRAAATHLRDAMATVLKADRDCRKYPADRDFADDRSTAEATLDRIVRELDFRALSRAMRVLFDEIRASAGAYAEANAAWLADRSDENRRGLFDATRRLAELRNRNAADRTFVDEMLGLARVRVFDG